MKHKSCLVCPQDWLEVVEKASFDDKEKLSCCSSPISYWMLIRWKSSVYLIPKAVLDLPSTTWMAAIISGGFLPCYFLACFLWNNLYREISDINIEKFCLGLFNFKPTFLNEGNTWPDKQSHHSIRLVFSIANSSIKLLLKIVAKSDRQKLSFSVALTRDSLVKRTLNVCIWHNFL